MTPASVGFQCPECVREGARSVRQPRTAYGGRRPGSPATVTMTLIAINVVVFVLVLATGRVRGPVLRQLWLLPTGGGPFPGVHDGAYWQLLTSVFTHVQIWHIGFNMLALYVLGPQLESLLGRARFLALYVLSGLTGSAVVYWWAGEFTPTLGASGAIFGLMAMLLVVAFKGRLDIRPLLGLLLVNVLLTVVGAVNGSISWQGHLGGFVGGLVVGSLLVYAPRERRTAWQVAGLGLVAVAIAIAVAARSAALG